MFQHTQYGFPEDKWQGAGRRLYCCLVPHQYEDKSCQRTALALHPTLHVTDMILMQTTSHTKAVKKAIEKSPSTVRKKRKH